MGTNRETTELRYKKNLRRTIAGWVHTIVLREQEVAIGVAGRVNKWNMVGPTGGRQGGELNRVWEVHEKSIRYKAMLQRGQVEGELQECINMLL